MADQQIVTFGAVRTAGAAMDQLSSYVLSLVDKPRPRVCCIPTATGDSPADLVRYYGIFHSGVCEPTHLELFNRTVRDIREFLVS